MKSPILVTAGLRKAKRKEKEAAGALAPILPAAPPVVSYRAVRLRAAPGRVWVHCACKYPASSAF